MPDSINKERDFKNNQEYELAIKGLKERHPIFSFYICDEASGDIINEVKLFLDGKIENWPLMPGQKIGGVFNRIGVFASWCLPLCRHFLGKDSDWLLPYSSSPNKKFIACDGLSQSEQLCPLKNSK